MQIGIIGAGNVGRAVGLAWLTLGHEILWGVPQPTDPKYADLGHGRLTMPAAAAQAAEMVVLATPWDVTEAAIRSLGDLAGKILLDCTNPLTAGRDGLSLAVGYSYFRRRAGRWLGGWGARIQDTKSDRRGKYGAGARFPAASDHVRRR